MPPAVQLLEEEYMDSDREDGSRSGHTAPHGTLTGIAEQLEEVLALLAELLELGARAVDTRKEHNLLSAGPTKSEQSTCQTCRT